jgi:hypothetical protein
MNRAVAILLVEPNKNIRVDGSQESHHFVNSLVHLQYSPHNALPLSRRARHRGMPEATAFNAKQ